ncbi:MAG: hypothetical protein KUA37_06565 [Desulfomicrobium sp.]|nr:hypothetical protein [Pseudomonadota bacterium]MBU4569718.1 hypothetical protein [Pseudomonadota bacterium]MBV1711654.1 hypothetical protein [Desulfomicrobium sp.]MBV1718729.1 hypothetical protein [Desulfomicrobium sp.]
MQLQINMLKRELEIERDARNILEKLVEDHIEIFESHVHTYSDTLSVRVSMRSKRNWENVSDDQLIIYVDPDIERQKEPAKDKKTSSPK